MIIIDTPKSATYQGAVVLSCRLLATEGRKELVKFSKVCGFPRPVFSREGRYDEHLKVSGRRVVEIVKSKLPEVVSQKTFSRILSGRRPK